jgi:predicted amidohydrolase YtcJ
MGRDSTLKLYYNGKVYTADKRDSVCGALAVKDGLVLASGEEADLMGRFGSVSELIDLKGNTVIPGLVDAHLHPLWGGLALSTRSFGYEDLGVPEMLERIRGFLAEDDSLSLRDKFLVVNCWRRTPGRDPVRKLLDALPGGRPIAVFSDDCHFAALNTAAAQKLQISKNTPQPPDGWIRLDGEGEFSGIIEDGPAFRAFDRVARLSGRAGHHAALKRAFQALSAQGVTTVLDARATGDTLGLAEALRGRGELPVRYLGAPEIPSGACATQREAHMALEAAAVLRDRHDTGAWGKSSPISVRHAKFFTDGMPSTLTAYTRAPYSENFGTEGAPDWRPGSWRGRPYFPPEALKRLTLAAFEAGFSPHYHVIADGALDDVLASVKFAREKAPRAGVRPAAAHLDLMAPDQYGLMRSLGVFAVLSFQWCGQDKESLERQRLLYGPERYQGLETHGKFLDAGVRAAYGSDWPVEPLDEWGNFQTGLTRRAAGKSGAGWPRMDTDRDLTLTEVLRAATITAAESLGREDFVGSLEKGKLADLAVIEGDLFALDKNEVHKARVLETVVGGKTVFRAAPSKENL